MFELFLFELLQTDAARNAACQLFFFFKASSAILCNEKKKKEKQHRTTHSNTNVKSTWSYPATNKKALALKPEKKKGEDYKANKRKRKRRGKRIVLTACQSLCKPPPTAPFTVLATNSLSICFCTPHPHPHSPARCPQLTTWAKTATVGHAARAPPASPSGTAARDATSVSLS